MASPDIKPSRQSEFVSGRPPGLWSPEEIKQLEWSGFDGKRITLFKSVRFDGKSDSMCYHGCKEKQAWEIGAVMFEPHSELKYRGGGFYANSLTVDWVHKYIRQSFTEGVPNTALVVEVEFENMLWYDDEQAAIKSSQLKVLDVRIADKEFRQLFPRLTIPQRARIGREARNWDDVLRILSEPR